VVHNPALSTEEKLARLKQNLFQNGGGLPQEFLEDLYEVFFVASPVNEENLAERAELLPELISLINREMDQRKDPFTREQWHEIGEVVSDFGIELDEGFLNYVMARVVERGAL
jgi:hypothetical protein